MGVIEKCKRSSPEVLRYFPSDSRDEFQFVSRLLQDEVGHANHETKRENCRGIEEIRKEKKRLKVD